MPLAADNADVRIGDWLIRRGTSRLERGTVERVLDPKALSVLLHLADRAPECVSTNDLLDRTWPGVVVGDNAVRQVIARLRRDLGDDAREPRYIETLPKRGYRLLAPVVAQPVAGSRAGCAPSGLGTAASADCLHAKDELLEQSKASPDSATRRWFPPVALVLMVVIGVVALALYRRADIGEVGTANEAPAETSNALPFGQLPESMTLGLLPFTVTGNDRQVAQFAEVVQVDLQAALGKTEISTTPAASAQFVAEGNARRVSESIRLSILVRRQRDGRSMWSRQLDVPAADLSEFKRAPFVARSIEAVFAYMLDAQNSTTDNELARNEYYDGQLAMSRWDFNVALGHFKRAVEIDPDYADAYENIAIVYATPGLGMRAEAASRPAHDAIRRALQLQPDFTFGLGFVNVQLDLDYEAAIRNFDHARRVGRFASGEVETWQCIAYFAWGDVGQALKYCQNAVSRGVVHIQNEALVHLGLVQTAAGHYRQARDAFARAIDSSGGKTLLHLMMILEATAALRQGDTEPGLELLATVFKTTDETSRYLFAGLLAALGRTNEATAVLRQAEVSFDRGSLPQIAFGFVFEGYRSLGDLNRAFVWLNRIIDERSPHLIGSLKSAPYLEEFRADPRFDDAMAKLRDIERQGTPTQSVATRCVEAPQDTPPKQPLVSCAFSVPGRQ